MQPDAKCLQVEVASKGRRWLNYLFSMTFRRAAKFSSLVSDCINWSRHWIAWLKTLANKHRSKWKWCVGFEFGRPNTPLMSFSSFDTGLSTNSPSSNQMATLPQMYCTCTRAYLSTAPATPSVLCTHSRPSRTPHYSSLRMKYSHQTMDHFFSPFLCLHSPLLSLPSWLLNIFSRPA